MDNIILTVDHEKKMKDAYVATKQLFQLASMNLREYLTNSEQINSHINRGDRPETKVLKILGLEWNATTDT